MFNVKIIQFRIIFYLRFLYNFKINNLYLLFYFVVFFFNTNKLDFLFNFYLIMFLLNFYLSFFNFY